MAIRILTAIALCLAATPAVAQTTDEAARRDLESLLLPGAEIGIGSILDGATATGDIQTRPFATKYPGLCGRNDVMIGYAGPVGAGPEAQAKRVPFTIGVISYYYAIRGVVKPEPIGWDDYHPFEGECAALTGHEDGWFRSNDAGHAAYGYDAFTLAVADIRSGKRRIPGCSRAGWSETICKDLAGLGYSNISSIWACPLKEAYTCYTVNQVTIHVRYDRNGAGTLVRVEYHPLPALD